MYVADMYIKAAQYDKMQRAFVGDYSSYKCINFKNRMYVTFSCLHGKTIRTKVAFSLNSWIYNKR